MYSYVLASRVVTGTWTPMTSEGDKSFCRWDGKTVLPAASVVWLLHQSNLYMRRVNIHWSFTKNQRRFFLLQEDSLLPTESWSVDASHLIPSQPNRFGAFFKDEWSKTVMSICLEVVETCLHQRALLLNEEYLCNCLIYILFLFSWLYFRDLFSC